ncbi:hypothetical protein EGR_06526 [Echinococcus granulosus]|uniref:Uncharacterized protein n=1 Tax=Echinococcus granulosus TaxID=6210 RepID=W6UB79_ECHGR|nr:hypothetical protein EGR_06526 [Echinococcus granulosus]EUB58643.1 hypothetical protein EGR_06526 [Echinococcus granulosus]
MGRERRNSEHRNGADDDVGCVTNQGSMEKGDIKEEEWGHKGKTQVMESGLEIVSDVQTAKVNLRKEEISKGANEGTQRGNISTIFWLWMGSRLLCNVQLLLVSMKHIKRQIDEDGCKRSASSNFKYLEGYKALVVFLMHHSLIVSPQFIYHECEQIQNKCATILKWSLPDSYGHEAPIYLSKVSQQILLVQNRPSFVGSIFGNLEESTAFCDCSTWDIEVMHQFFLLVEKNIFSSRQTRKPHFLDFLIIIIIIFTNVPGLGKVNEMGKMQGYRELKPEIKYFGF